MQTGIGTGDTVGRGKECLANRLKEPIHSFLPFSLITCMYSYCPPMLAESTDGEPEGTQHSSGRMG